ncbi:MAG TPA: SRPBCC family protein [Verrucomicrobiae bacterium]|nr:SRPBCC family protein [Verrucomicrobiae bacterium]
MAARDEDAARSSRPRRVAPAVKSGRGVRFQKTITVNRPVQEVFSFWRHLENLPRFMKFVRAVTSNGGNITHWVVTTNGTKLEWDAETIEARPNEVLSWQSLPAADVDNAGSIVFRPAPGKRGTVVNVNLKYAPTGGKAAAKLAKLFGKDAEAVMEEDLFRFKSLIETGEIPTTEGQPHGGV